MVVLDTHPPPHIDLPRILVTRITVVYACNMNRTSLNTAREVEYHVALSNLKALDREDISHQILPIEDSFVATISPALDGGQDAHPPVSCPEGGLEGWLTVAGG